MESFWSWLTTPPILGEVLNLFGTVYLAIFVVGFVVSGYLSGFDADQLVGNPLQVHGVKHWATIGLCIFGPGLFFFGMRALQINPLSFGEPIWLVASVVALLAAAIRCANWWRTDFPAAPQIRDPDEPSSNSCGPR